MKVLVTGGLGFIGSNFCKYLLESKPESEIINVDKIGIGANLDNLSEIQNDNRYSFVDGDIRNPLLMNRLITKIDAIVNIAAETHVDRSISDPTSFLENNTIGTFNILEAIRKHNRNARLVHISTDEVYGQALKGSFTEKDTLLPSNPYSASKTAADMFVLSYCRTYGLDASITRCTNNFGPYQLAEKLIPKTIIRALKGMTIPVYGSGSASRDWIYVQDHCAAILRVLEQGQAGEIYNISADNEVTNIDLVLKILHQLNKPESLIEFVEDRPGHDKRYNLNSNKIRSLLGWQPTYIFEDALDMTVNWYLQNRGWWDSLATDGLLNPTPWRLILTN